MTGELPGHQGIDYPKSPEPGMIVSKWAPIRQKGH